MNTNEQINNERQKQLNAFFNIKTACLAINIFIIGISISKIELFCKFIIVVVLLLSFISCLLIIISFYFTSQSHSAVGNYRTEKYKLKMKNLKESEYRKQKAKISENYTPREKRCFNWAHKTQNTAIIFTIVAFTFMVIYTITNIIISGNICS